ncbi:hypothetical protein VB715_21855 [Crocosphaera sp. UHCC 0190]|uniref:hypothetical protein n=1 Tax=Crocosphaera sp. UHCC 0190 TaxID=3110246 RepID=UPI002B215A76|nr:hypothetical protein [Crocosphaera sp. UHCC 0190]MEA5512415.1 hypothetical protein [Crocosphaera sp. UHCC 0190]
MMSLPESIESEFKQEIRSYEEDLQMPYVTSVERLARQEGVLQQKREVDFKRFVDLYCIL